MDTDAFELEVRVDPEHLELLEDVEHDEAGEAGPHDDGDEAHDVPPEADEGLRGAGHQDAVESVARGGQFVEGIHCIFKFPAPVKIAPPSRPPV